MMTASMIVAALVTGTPTTILLGVGVVSVSCIAGVIHMSERFPQAMAFDGAQRRSSFGLVAGALGLASFGALLIPTTLAGGLVLLAFAAALEGLVARRLWLVVRDESS